MARQSAESAKYEPGSVFYELREIRKRYQGTMGVMSPWEKGEIEVLVHREELKFLSGLETVWQDKASEPFDEQMKQAVEWGLSRVRSAGKGRAADVVLETVEYLAKLKGSAA